MPLDTHKRLFYIELMSKVRSAVSDGFTLIELLVVIGILGILLAIVLIAINPARQFAMANNTSRSASVSTVLNAISQYMADNRGKIPTGIPTSPTVGEIASGAGNADICSLLVPKYVAQLPVDPKTGYQYTSCSSYDTGFQVTVDTNGRVTVSAPNAESIDNQAVTISVTR